MLPESPSSACLAGWDRHLSRIAPSYAREFDASSLCAFKEALLLSVCRLHAFSITHLEKKNGQYWRNLPKQKEMRDQATEAMRRGFFLHLNRLILPSTWNQQGIPQNEHGNLVPITNGGNGS